MLGTRRDPDVTDRSSAGMSEFTWYSRLAAWIGAAMLLVQSVLDRDAGPVTVLAVLLLGFGLLCFLIGLAVDSRAPGTEILLGTRTADQHPDETAAEVSEVSVRMQPALKTPEPQVTAPPLPDPVQQRNVDAAPAASAPAASRPTRRPKFRERAKKTESRPARQVESPPEPVPPQNAVVEQVQTPTASPSIGVPTEMLSSTSVLVGEACPRCGRPLQVGELAAGCPVCGRTHHALCWMENQFHCAAPDCTGHGSLEAPAVAHTPGGIPAD
jgi:hypothetical protein